MRSVLARTAAALMFSLLAAAAPTDDEVEPPPDRKNELRRMNGTYDVVLFERNGESANAARLRTMKVILKDGEGSFLEGNSIFTSKITIFPQKRPREVDCVYTNGPLNGTTIKGIYKIEKGKFTCCYGDISGQRPKDFSAGPNSGNTLYALERAKEK